MNINEELLKYNFSRETLAKLQEFAGILEEWNAKMNLVSKNSMSDLWPRHIMDSLQLIKYFPESFDTLVDIGSGAGFPALILAIALAEKKPNVRLKLVESITKKTVYLNDVVQRLNLKNVEVLNTRVENAVFKDVDVVTARAVASLDVLLSYQYKIGGKNTIGLYLKGKSHQEEIDKAAKEWAFDFEKKANIYSEDGVILKISGLRRKK